MIEPQLQSMLEKSELLSAEEERQLGALAHGGNVAARERLIFSQLRWAFKLSRRRAIRNDHALDGDDLFQSAILAVVRSVDYFDPAKGRLSSYVAMAVITECRRHILRFATTGITLPISPSSRQCFQAETGYLSDIDPQSSLNSPAAEAEIHEEAAQLLAEIDRLPAAQRSLMRMRLDGMSLTEIGREMNFSRERARQIEQAALCRLCQRFGVPFKGQSLSRSAGF